MTPTEIKSLIERIRAQAGTVNLGRDGQGADYLEEETVKLLHAAADGLESVLPKEEKIPYSEIVAAYHLLLPDLRKVLKLTETRRRQLRARWNEDKERQDPEWWRNLFRRVAKSDFLMGRRRSRNPDHANWTCDFDFLLQPKSLTKLLEGGYDNRDTGRPVSSDIFDVALHNRRGAV